MAVDFAGQCQHTSRRYILLTSLGNLDSSIFSLFLDFRPHISGGGSFDLDVSGLTVSLSMKLGEF